MKLKDILSKINHKFPENIKNLNPNISSIEIDSRLVKKNSIFFALQGINSHGADFIDHSIKKGACVIFCDRDFDRKTTSNNIIFIKCGNIFEILVNFLKIFYHPLPSNIFAVTGTNGKTSTAEFIRQIINFCNYECASIGTLGVKCSKDLKNIVNSNLTSPDIVSLYKNLHNFKKNNIDNVVLEASSIALDQNRISGIKINSAIFTNFTQDHLDYHKNMANYFKCKMILFNKFANKSSSAIINADIKEYHEISRICSKQNLKISDYGVNAKSFKIKSIVKNKDHQEVSLIINGLNYKFKIATIIYYEAINIICALSSVIDNFNLNNNQILELLPKLSNINSAQGRMQKIATLKNNATIYIDFAHTPDSIENVLKQARLIAKSKLMILFGCGGNRDTSKRSIMGKISSNLSDLTIISDDNPRFEDANQIRKDIIKGCIKNKFIEIADRKKAIHEIILKLEKDDILILAGKGHENYQIIGDKKIAFSEEKIVKEFIKKTKF
jgi:UDP-N-acetylmuramoyl-L-alanyl-D-glutamate--2,6-diaminopimelate ligase